MRECRWLKPVLVGRFQYLEQTPDHHLRHARFVALRDDREPGRRAPGDLGRQQANPTVHRPLANTRMVGDFEPGRDL
jgi:ATP-dependent DNA ligase